MKSFSWETHRMVSSVAIILLLLHSTSLSVQISPHILFSQCLVRKWPTNTHWYQRYQWYQFSTWKHTNLTISVVPNSIYLHKVQQYLVSCTNSNLKCHHLQKLTLNNPLILISLKKKNLLKSRFGWETHSLPISMQLLFQT